MVTTIYFPGGSLVQHKISKNFLSVYHHQQYFKTISEWHFFAACHEKRPCDGIGGNFKMNVRKKKFLKNHIDDQIITLFDMFNF